jgi:uncharacterized protein YbjT (DUF2867 family)
VEAGWPVRVLLFPQRGGRIQLPWPGLLVETVLGSIYQPEDLTQAMQGVHTVFHLTSAQWWGGARDLERVDVGGTRQVVETAREVRIGRLVVMSHLGAAPASAYPLLRVKGELESVVCESGLPYTIIRSGVLFGEQDRFVNAIAMVLRANPVAFFQPGQGENLLHPLCVHDLVAGLVRSMDDLDAVDRVLEIGGPEYLSFNEMVRTVMRVTHAQRMIVSVPPHTLRWMTRVIVRIFPRWPTTPQWFDILSSHRTASLSSMSDAFGITPVRFEDTILTYMPGQHYLPQLLRFLFRRRRPRGV